MISVNGASAGRSREIRVWAAPCSSIVPVLYRDKKKWGIGVSEDHSMAVLITGAVSEEYYYYS